MALLTTALDTEFTPAVGPFNVQVTDYPATLMRKNASAVATFAVVYPHDFESYTGQQAFLGALVCQNYVAGAVYKFVSGGAATVRADQ